MLYENATARELEIRQLKQKIEALQFRERDFGLSPFCWLVLANLAYRGSQVAGGIAGT